MTELGFLLLAIVAIGIVIFIGYMSYDFEKNEMEQEMTLDEINPYKTIAELREQIEAYQEDVHKLQEEINRCVSCIEELREDKIFDEVQEENERLEKALIQKNKQYDSLWEFTKTLQDYALRK